MFLLFEDLGFSELILIGVASVLFFGKRLPEVAAQAGAQIAKFRRSLQDIKQETGMDHEVRKLQRTFEDVRHDLSVSELARAAKQKVEQRLAEVRDPLDVKLEESVQTQPAPSEDPLSGTIAHGAPDPACDAASPPPSWKPSDPAMETNPAPPSPQDKPAA